jgi:hypothetical protein
MNAVSQIAYVDHPTPGVRWHILDVMKKGTPPPFRRGRPPNIWVAILIDMEPDQFQKADHFEAKSARFSCLSLGRHSTRDAAYDHAECMIAAKH